MDCFLDAKLASSDPPALEDLQHAMAADSPRRATPPVRRLEGQGARGAQSAFRARVRGNPRAFRATAPTLHEHDDPAAVFAAEFKARLRPVSTAPRVGASSASLAVLGVSVWSISVARDGAPGF